jgi:hypothetical protein
MDSCCILFAQPVSNQQVENSLQVRESTMMTNNTYARHPTSPEADLTCQQVTALLVADLPEGE